MKTRFIVLVLVMICSLWICGAVAAEEEQSPDDLYQQAEQAVANNSYKQAFNLYMNALSGYEAAGNEKQKREALRQAKRMSWLFAEMPLNRTSADETIAAAFPNFTASERAAFLEPGASIQFESDGQMNYFEGIARNIKYHNASLSQEFTHSLGESPFFDQVSPYISAPRDEKNPLYQNHTFRGTGLLSIPREQLPDNGTLQVWFPLPVSFDSQEDISVTSVQPEEYVVSGPVITGEIGEVYLEFPLEEITEDYVNVSVSLTFTSSPRILDLDPESIPMYDTADPLYLRYTKSQPNLNVTPEITALAREIVGDETNPYKKARLIYDYILNTLPYSNVPHAYLNAMPIPESDFVHDTGFGDCGTQSVYFAALCRAVGIPARAPGGYQIVPGHQGTHFWAEFYLPEYGWIPVDVTVADAADWAYNATPEQVEEYKDFFFGNLDPYRFTIQTDVDEPFSGEPNPDILMTFVHQKPAVICTSSDSDVEMLGMVFSSYTFEDLTAE